jgi:tripartite-type tricarboxylate transporter receptor subunit TctC
MAFDRRRFLVLSTAGVSAVLTVPRLAWADDWPSRNLRTIIPYSPGGSSDIIARLIAGPMADRIKQTLIVDSRPGANGNLGAALAVQAKDDGHTILLCDVDGLAISPAVYKNLTFTPTTDLCGIAMLAYSPHVLAVHPSVPAHTLPELVALSRRKHLNFAVTAIGSAPHLAGVAVQLATDAKWDYVPYKGGAQAVTDTITGQTEIIMNGLLATLPHIRSGRLRAIAISARERMDLVPAIPTISEQGVAGFESGTWQGVLAPATMPMAHRLKLAAALKEVMLLPAVKTVLNQQGAEIVFKNPAEMDRFLATETTRWASVVKSADIHLD